MKTLVVLSALAVAALAGPTFPEDITDIEANKNLKRSPTFKHHSIGIPVHHVPVHHTFVQPVIPHHLGLKKPLHFHGHHYRAEGEEVDAHSTSMESKETKTKCMKEMEAKCGDDTIAKSSELQNTKIEDVSDISESDVEQSLLMAKEAVNNLQKNLQKAEKNFRMSQWKHGESEADQNMHQDIETAKQALDHMQLNFGNLESLNVHASTFKESGVHDAHIELSKSEQARLSQWKDAIENIQKNVELVKNIEDSFQQNENTEMKSAAFEKSSQIKQAQSKHELSTSNLAHNKDTILGKHASEMGRAEKFNEHEKKSDMESSASTTNESTRTFKTLNDQNEKFSRSESGQSQSNQEMQSNKKNDAAIAPFGVVPVVAGKKMTAQGLQTVENKDQTTNGIAEKTTGAKQIDAVSSAKAMKSSENEGTQFTQFNEEKSAPVLDTTTLMKSANTHGNAELTSNSEKALSSMKNIENIGSDSHMEHSRSSNLDSSKSQVTGHKSLDMSSSIHSKNEQHNTMMKSSDQLMGQSEHSEAVMKGSLLSNNAQHNAMMKSSDQLMGQNLHSEAAMKSVSNNAQHNTMMKSSDQLRGQNLNSEAVMKSNNDQHSEAVMKGSLLSNNAQHNAMMKSSDQLMGQNLHSEAVMKSVSNNDQHNTMMKSSDQLMGQNLHSEAVMKGSLLSNNAPHNTMMKSSDQLMGQSEHSEAVLKSLQHGHQLEKSSHINSFGAHGKSAEGDSFSSQTGFTGLNTGFKSSLDVPKTKSWKEASWKEASLKDGSFKSAYGGGVGLGSGYGIGGVSGGSGGAVGVFPNAHVGGCAIPLLLSCSPNVVTGSLAKAHSSYGAPSYAGAGAAYRGSDNTNTHDKREITKIGTKTKRAPYSNLKQRPILITAKSF